MDLLEAEGEALQRRLQADDVLPSLKEIFWLGDSLALVRKSDRRSAVMALGVPRERLEAALVGPLCRWMVSKEGPDEEAVVAWAVAASAGLLGSFVAP